MVKCVVCMKECALHVKFIGSGELVGIASIERFVYLVNLRTLKEEIVDTGPGAIASMKFVDNSHGLNYLLITKV